MTACLLVLVAAAGCGGQSGSGAQRKIDPADQRWAERQLLRLGDLPAGWKVSAPDEDDSDPGCDNIRASGLTLTGESSAEFETPEAELAAHDVALFATADQARRALDAGTVKQFGDCLESAFEDDSDPDLKDVKIENQSLKKLQAMAESQKLRTVAA